jgi:hypothetical protein
VGIVILHPTYFTSYISRHLIGPGIYITPLGFHSKFAESMASPPLSRRHTELNERLRQLDDAYIPSITPTNTWLANLQQPQEGDVSGDESFDDDTPTEEHSSISGRRNRFEEPSGTTRRSSQEGRKTSLTEAEPRSSSLPPAIQKSASAPRPDLARTETAYLLDVDAPIRRVVTDP